MEEILSTAEKEKKAEESLTSNEIMQLWKMYKILHPLNKEVAISGMKLVNDKTGLYFHKALK